MTTTPKERPTVADSVEGYTRENPVSDEDWNDEVRWQINLWWSEKPMHDRDGYIAEYAGSEKCLALGHVIDPDGEWNADTHPWGWGLEPMCPATQYDTACTRCESSECEFEPTDARAFWKMFEGAPHE